MRQDWLLALLLVAAPPAVARADDQQAAIEEFTRAKQAYIEGRFEDAIRGYERAMRLKHSAKLHYNIGLACEKLGQHAKARDAFTRYLKEEPNAGNAGEVRGRIAALERKMKEGGQVAPPRPAPASSPAPAPAPAPSPAPAPAPAPSPAPVRGPAPFPPALPPRVAPPPLRPAPGAVPTPATGAPAGTAPAYTGYYGNPHGAVTVDFDSRPQRAELFLNGRLVGITPLRLNMVPGATYHLACERQGFAPERRVYTVRDHELVQFDLHLTVEGKTRQMTRSEWFALEPMIGFGAGSNVPSFGLGLLIVGLKWRQFNWTILELGAAGGGMSLAWAGTRPSFPLYFGERGQHQLRIGLGLSIAYMESLKQDLTLDSSATVHNQVGGTGMLVSPSFEYRYQTERSFFIGVALRPHIMVTGDLKTTQTRDGRAETPRPWAVMLTLPLGWASSSI